jgi:predicted enzyme related to lactoylglutathione lyase
MPRVVHFEIAAKEPERTAEFYANVFGWTVKKWEGPEEYWLISTNNGGKPGIDGGIHGTNNLFTGYVNTIEVPAIDDYLILINKSGGKVLTDKMTIPGVGFLAYCKDPDGNIFGLMQPCESAGEES